MAFEMRALHSSVRPESLGGHLGEMVRSNEREVLADGLLEKGQYVHGRE